MTTANKITLGRIALIPVFVTLAIYYGQSQRAGAPQEWLRWAAVGAFLLAALSDGLDGYIARHYNQRSRLGVILDPIADKGLLLAGIITLSFAPWAERFPIWFFVLVIARDVVVVTGALILHVLNGSVRVRAVWTGKWATALQMTSLVLVMLQWNFFRSTLQVGRWAVPVSFLDVPIVLAGLFTALSGAEYVMVGIEQLHDRGHGDPAQHDQAITAAETNPEQAPGREERAG